MRMIRLAAALVLVVLLAGCGGAGNSGDPEAAPPTAEGTTAPAGGPLAKEAVAAFSTHRLRLEMLRVERHPEESVLRFAVTNLGDQLSSVGFGTSMAGAANFDFKLVDPVGHKAYTPLYDEAGQTVGSDAFTFSAEPQVRYEAELHFPPIPEGVETLTVLTPSTAGEFTGVPVVDAAAAQTPAATATPGAAMPVRTPQGKVSGGVYDLYGIVEDPVKVTATSNTEERVGLRADVLFAFDSAGLSDRARQILDDVAADVRAKADPAQPPIHIEGHTDGRGAHDYNVRLSQQRAQAVLQELQARLGGDYQYQAEGKGETERIAEEGGADDEQARQRNRRVEVSYQIKQQTPGTATASGGPRERVGGGAGQPAAFRPTDGETVATRTVEWSDLGVTQQRRIDVKPFYRDGGYLVVVFEITNLGTTHVPEVADYGNLGVFEQFSVLDPATDVRYSRVRIGPEAWGSGVPNLMHVDPGWAVFNTAPGSSNRGFFYVPAPPADVSTVTFDAGGFGQFPNIPVVE